MDYLYQTSKNEIDTQTDNSISNQFDNSIKNQLEDAITNQIENVELLKQETLNNIVEQNKNINNTKNN